MTVVPASADGQQRAAEGSVAADPADAIVELLADGQLHTVRELWEACGGACDPKTVRNALNALCALRLIDRVNIARYQRPRWGYRLPQGSEEETA